MNAPTEYLVVLSEPDPIARAVSDAWGTIPATDEHVEGAPIRRLNERVLVLRTVVRHIHDDRLGDRLPKSLRETGVPLVFPSIHRSERGVDCFTVHPLGNLGPTAEVGGAPRTLVPAPARLMASALRSLAEAGASIGLPATFEATHHGPTLAAPAFFAEVGFPVGAPAPTEAVRVLAKSLEDLVPDPSDRVAVGVGGGHYMPHQTELTLERRWAFGHLVPRHALPEIDRAMAEQIFRATPGAEGWLFARAADAALSQWDGLGARLRDRDAPGRGTA